MPGIWDILNKSLIPMKGVTDMIDNPQGDYNPLEARLRGFAAGALEGAADTFTSPAGLAMTALPGGGLSRALRGLKSAARGSQAAPKATLDLIDDVPVEQVMPKMDDVDALLGDMQRNLARIPPKQMSQGIVDDAGRQLVDPKNLHLNDPNLRPRQIPHHPAPPVPKPTPQNFVANERVGGRVLPKDYITADQVAEMKAKLDAARRGGAGGQ